MTNGLSILPRDCRFEKESALLSAFNLAPYAPNVPTLHCGKNSRNPQLAHSATFLQHGMLRLPNQVLIEIAPAANPIAAWRTDFNHHRTSPA